MERKPSRHLGSGAVRTLFLRDSSPAEGKRSQKRIKKPIQPVAFIFGG